MAKPKHTDLEGQRFGMLTVLKRAGCTGRYGIQYWCKCDCGLTAMAYGCYLVNGVKTSCGCKKRDNQRPYLERKRRFNNVFSQTTERMRKGSVGR